MKLDAVLLTTLVLIHHVVAALHGNAHTELAVSLSALQNAFVNIVILLIPLLGAVLVWTRFYLPGQCLVVGGMLGALIFGVYHHYMLVSPDHIAHLPAGPAQVQQTFIWTAGVLAIMEGLSAAVAAYFLGQTFGDAHLAAGE